jgi:transposase
MSTARYLIAGRGYDSAALRDWLTARGTIPVIPPRANRKLQYHYEKKLYCERNIIGRTFNRFKDLRRIATRFDRNLKTYLAALCLSGSVVWWLQRVWTEGNSGLKLTLQTIVKHGLEFVIVE